METGILELQEQPKQLIDSLGEKTEGYYQDLHMQDSPVNLGVHQSHDDLSFLT